LTRRRWSVPPYTADRQKNRTALNRNCSSILPSQDSLPCDGSLVHVCLSLSLVKARTRPLKADLESPLENTRAGRSRRSARAERSLRHVRPPPPYSIALTATITKSPSSRSLLFCSPLCCPHRRGNLPPLRPRAGRDLCRRRPPKSRKPAGKSFTSPTAAAGNSRVFLSPCNLSYIGSSLQTFLDQSRPFAVKSLRPITRTLGAEPCRRDLLYKGPPHSLPHKLLLPLSFSFSLDFVVWTARCYGPSHQSCSIASSSRRHSCHSSLPPFPPSIMASVASARYGKDNVRVYKVERDEKTGVQTVIEMTVCVLLEGEIESS
jgi:hypothetical protein